MQFYPVYVTGIFYLFSMDGCTCEVKRKKECVKVPGKMNDLDVPRQIQRFSRLMVELYWFLGQLQRRDGNSLQERLR